MQGTLRDSYLAVVCSALIAYQQAGYPLTLESQDQGDGALTIAFTLGEGQRYHSILDPMLRAVMAPTADSDAASA